MNAPKPSFFAELQRRHVYKVGAAYAVAGWLLVQVITQVFPIYDISAHVQRIFVGVIITGFPVALVLAWLFDLTPTGIVRTEGLPTSAESPAAVRERRGADRKLNYVLGGLLLLATGYFLLDHTLLRRGSLANTEAVSAPITAAATDTSIAVLPFENLSSEKENAFFAVGIQDEILTRLAKIGALKVISRTSTQHYASSPDNLPEIAKQLGVANILEGSVQRIGNAVRVNVQLIRASSDAHLWAETFDRKLDDVFAVEGEVAQSVVETLKARLSPGEAKELAAMPTTNVAAYDAYLRGRALGVSGGALRQVTFEQIASFSEAVRLDPGFAAAWAELTKANAFAYWQLDPSAAHREAAASALEHALALAPEALATRKSQAFSLYWIDRDYTAAAAIFERIRQQAPSDPDATGALGAIARRQGRWHESLELLQQAVLLDPLNPLIFINAISTANSQRDITAAQRLLDQALAVAPNSPEIVALQIELLLQQGRFDEAQNMLERVPIAVANDNLVDDAYASAVWTRHYSFALALLDRQLQAPERLGQSLGPYLLKRGDLLRLSGDAAAARANYLQAREWLLAALKDEPHNARLNTVLAQVYAGLEAFPEALEAARRAIALLPRERDAYVGPDYEEVLARVEARGGDKESALRGLETLLRTSYGDPPLTPAILRVDPDFDGLRDDPRFLKLLADNAAAVPGQGAKP